MAGQAEAPRETDGKTQARDGEGAGRSETRAAPPVAGLRSKKPFRALRRLDPEVVTEEPAEDDEEVYGDAWPLVVEWRSLRADHPHRGKSLSWLVTEERLLTLELAMLALEGLGGHPECVEKAGVAALGAANPHPGAVAEVAERSRVESQEVV